MNDEHEHECDDECYHHLVAKDAYRALCRSLKRIEVREVTLCMHSAHTKAVYVQDRVIHITEMDSRFDELSRRTTHERVIVLRGPCAAHQSK